MKSSLDENRQKILYSLDAMEYEFGRQEAFFLNDQTREQRLQAYEMQAGWAVHEKSRTSNPLARERLARELRLYRSIMKFILECERMKGADPVLFRRKRVKAYRKAQMMHFGIHAVKRTFSKIDHRPEEPRLIRRITQHYIASPQGIRDVDAEMVRIREMLDTGLRGLPPDEVRMRASKWVEEKLPD